MSSKAELVRDGRGVEPMAWAIPDAHFNARGSARPAAADTAVAEAEQRGFAAGYAQGEEAIGHRVKDQQRRLADTIEQLAALRSVVIHEAERQLVQLAAAIAGCVLRREIAMDRTILLAIARAAIDRLGESPHATVHLHPDDYAEVRALQAGEYAAMKIVPDPIVQPGGCLVQSDLGTIEAGVAVQLEELSAVLLDNDVPMADERSQRAGPPAA